MSDTAREQIAEWLEIQELDAPTWDEFDAAIVGLSVHAPGRAPLVVYSFDRMMTGRTTKVCIYCGGPKGVHDACPALSNGQPCSFPRGRR